MLFIAPPPPPAVVPLPSGAELQQKNTDISVGVFYLEQSLLKFNGTMSKRAAGDLSRMPRRALPERVYSGHKKTPPDWVVHLFGTKPFEV